MIALNVLIVCVCVWEASGLKNCSISGHLAVVAALSVSMPVLKDFVSFVRVMASFTQTPQQWRIPHSHLFLPFLICLLDFSSSLLSLRATWPNTCLSSFCLSLYLSYQVVNLYIYSFNNCCVHSFVSKLHVNRFPFPSRTAFNLLLLHFCLFVLKGLL